MMMMMMMMTITQMIIYTCHCLWKYGILRIFVRSRPGMGFDPYLLLLTTVNMTFFTHIRPLNGRALRTTCDVINLNVTGHS